MSNEFKELPGPFVQFEPVTCFKIVVRTGEGVVDDPARWVRAWFTEEGELISYEDPHDKRPS